MAGRVAKGGRTKACRLRESQDIPLDVPLPDILDLAERGLGLHVLIFEELAEDVAGVYLCRDDDRLVLLNGSDAVVRVRFTLAHELCHHCFDDPAQVDTYAGIRREGDWRERRANAFASELLMPERAVAAWRERRGVDQPDLYDVVAFGLEFGVSTLAAFFRLWDVIPGMKAEPLRRAIDHGDHLPIVAHGDPYRDSLWEACQALPRIPPRFRTSVFFRVAVGDLTVREGARRLGCTDAQLRAALEPLGLLPPA